jgi:5-methylcytosine-specific restriction endonuclease McrA
MVKPTSIRHPAERAQALQPAAMKAKPLVSRASTLDREVIDRLYKSPEWRAVREIVISISSGECCACRSTRDLQVDHIHPVAIADSSDRIIDPDGLQLLCARCHDEKTKRYDSDHLTRVRGHDPRRDRRTPQRRELLRSLGRRELERRGIDWSMTVSEWSRRH